MSLNDCAVGVGLERASDSNANAVLSGPSIRRPCMQAQLDYNRSQDEKRGQSWLESSHMKGRSVCSWMGRASISARKPTVGLPLPTVATTPVSATGYLLVHRANVDSRVVGGISVFAAARTLLVISIPRQSAMLEVRHVATSLSGLKRA